MIPIWMFVSVSVLLVICIAGWSWTIRKSVSRALYMYDLGVTHERERKKEVK